MEAIRFPSNHKMYLIALPLFLSLGCGAGSVGGGGMGPDGTRADSGSGVPSPPGVAGGEICDGYDNDLDGEIDEGCTCTPGQSAACYPGAPGVAGVGICQRGVFQCKAGGEFSTWGACIGAVTPAAEICGNGIDEDCDGVDLPCGKPPGGGTADQGVAVDQGSAADQGVGSVADVGVKQPPDAGPPADTGPPTPPPPIKLPLFILGDCVFASCPPNAPHPVGCQVIFPPNSEPQGCVAHASGSPTVFFKAGESCKKGLVTGFLLCSKSPGPPLGPLNCPILGKSKWFYPSSSAGCPH